MQVPFLKMTPSASLPPQRSGAPGPANRKDEKNVAILSYTISYNYQSWAILIVFPPLGFPLLPETL